MFELIALIVAALAAPIGFVKARSYVRGRLRYVDSVQKPATPFVAGLVAALVAAPVVWILPVIGAGTAILFGVGVGAGVMKGARDIRRASYQIEG